MPDNAERAAMCVEAMRWCLKAEFGIDIPREADARLAEYVIDALRKSQDDGVRESLSEDN